MNSTPKRVLYTALSALALCVSANTQAQSAYRYRDDKGNWVYTDRKPDDTLGAEQISIRTGPAPPLIGVERVESDHRISLRAINECACTVEFGLRIIDPKNIVVNRFGDVENGIVHSVLPPGTDRTLVELTPTGAGAATYEVDWGLAFGAPGAQHRPVEPYRAPYAVGREYRITQAYPSAITHVTASSRFAVDIALPDQTGVYAARAGRVVNIAHEHFRGGTTAAMMDEANFVQILHDDETIAMYAHLHWDSIRVRVGQAIQRGEYIADSGNTGFSSGAHLHFAVTRNIGLRDESVPIVFEGPNGEAIKPQVGMMLKAH